MVARGVRFVGVGGLATLVHILIALAAEAGLGMSDLAANLAGWMTAISVSYFGHLHVTFGAASAPARQVPRFAITSLAGLTTSSAIVAGVTGLGGSFAVAMVLVAIGVPVMTFFLLRFWVFDEAPERDLPAVSDLLVPLAAGAGLLALFRGQMLHHDVVWYHVATRQWLDGAALYIDIVEVNPPLNFYLTLPVIWLADLTGLSDTGAQYLVLAALTTVSLCLVARELRAIEGIPERQRLLLLAGMGVLLSFLALRDVGQREHLFILMALPWLVSRIALGTDGRGREVCLAALAAVVMCLKPFFVVFPAAILIAEALRARSPAPLFSRSAWVFLGTGGAYVAAVLALHPTYLAETLPMARLVYGAYGAALVDVLGMVAPSLGVLVLAGGWTLSRPSPPRGAVVFFAVALAGVVSYLWQGTGFTYHTLPFVIFGATACLFASVDPRCRAIALVALATLVVEVGHRGFYDNGAVSRIVPVTQDLGPVDRLLVISTHVFAGPIVASEAGAEWVSPYPAQWLVPGAESALARTDCTALPARCQAIRAIADRNRDDLIVAMTERRPDMIIFDKSPGYFAEPFFDWKAWLGVDPAFLRAMGNYRLTAEDDRFEYWRRLP